MATRNLPDSGVKVGESGGYPGSSIRADSLQG